MRQAVIISALGHLLLVAVGYFGIPALREEPLLSERVIIVEMVAITEERNLPQTVIDDTEPEEPKTAEQPPPPPPEPPAPPEPEPEVVTLPEPKPEPKKEPAPEFEQLLGFVGIPVRMQSVELPSPTDLRSVGNRDDPGAPYETDECACGESASAEAEDEDFVAGAIIEDEEAVCFLNVCDQRLAECPAPERLVRCGSHTLVVKHDLVRTVTGDRRHALG